MRTFLINHLLIHIILNPLSGFKNEQGHIVAWDIVAYIIYDYFQEREIVWFFGRDVTQRIEHESKVKEMNSILECILNNVPVYLFVKDPSNEFRYLYWNRAFEEYSRIPASRALGHTDYVDGCECSGRWSSEV